MKQFRRHGRKGLTLWLLEQFYNLIEGDHLWAERRSILLVTATLVFILMGRAVEQISPSNWWTLEQDIAKLPGVIQFVLSLVHPQTLRHALPPVIAILWALGVASNYVRDLFELPDYETGNEYLMAAMFGANYPYIGLKSKGYEIDEATIKRMGRDVTLEAHPIVKIGGPGYVNVAQGNVALFEHVGGPSQVVGTGLHFIRRFETLREVVDLRDQFRERSEVKAMTKDGIAVTVQNAQVSFRVRTSNRPRTRQEVYPFSVSAVKRIAYGKTVGPKGPSTWTESVPNSAAGNIRGYISRTLLDDLIARPEGEAHDPRDKIKAIFDHKDTRRRFNDMGVDLLWVSLGHIKTPQDVLDNRVFAWSAGWERQAKVTLSEGEAHSLRLMEYAKAMARVDLIETMMQTLPTDISDTQTAEMIVIQLLEALNMIGRKIGATPDPIRDIITSADRLKAMLGLPITTKGDKSAGNIVIQNQPSDRKSGKHRN
jgi:regulator of protease activity HflC (stomatin/prohibitin superfamily)